MSMHPGGGSASRTLRAVFSVDTAQAEQGLDRVAAKTEQAATRMEKAGQKADQLGTKTTASAAKSESALGRMARSAEENGAAWQQVGGVLTGVGVATTALGAAVAKTGIEYNTLRQTSVAALTTLLGSAEAANAQMAKLDDFASNSPFARQVFIQAQRQLIGFGMAAEDVLPTLDAIQNAVAATGGSNNDIAELTRIIAQVGAAGKISAVDLMQFGQRGVDAASLIGSQMGKTGAQIRDEITAGTLDADAAIAALTAGMQERFGGAAANVKDTMAGAADRIRAAFRDLSASVMSSAVDPTGGGWLVDLTNQAADFLRWIERIPGPVRNTVFAIGGLAGVASLAAGAFLIMAPRAVETWTALGKMGTVGTAAQTGIRGVGRAAQLAAGPAMLGALLAILSSVGQGMLDTGDSANELENRLRQLSAGANIDALITGADGIDDFNAALARTADPNMWQRIDNGVDDFFNGIFAVVTAGHDGREALDQFRQSIPGLDTALSQMASQSLPDAVAGFQAVAEAWDLNDRGMTALIDSMPAFRDHLVGIANEQGLAADNATLLALATGELVPAVEGAAGAQEGLGDALDGTTGMTEEQLDAIQALRDAYTEWIADIGGVSASFATIEGALAQHQAATQEWAEGQVSDVEGATDTWEDYYDGFTVNLAKYLDELASMVEAQANWQGNIEALVGRVSDATIDHLARLGPEGAPLVQALVDGTAEELARFDELFAASGQGAGEAWAEGLRAQQAVYEAAAAQLGEAAAAKILERIQAGEISAAEAVLQYDLEAELGLSTDPAAEDLLAYVAEVELTTATAKLDADTGLALGGVDMWVFDAESRRPKPLLLADADPAKRETDAWAAEAAGKRPVPVVDANTGLAHQKVIGWAYDAASQRPVPILSVDTGPAYSGLYGFLNSIPRSVSVALNAVPVLGGVASAMLRLAGGGFAEGGYTGAGSKYEPKGVVHADEFVHTKEHTSRPGMLNFHTDLWRTDDVDTAYARYKARGYAGGGPVGGTERRFSYAPQAAMSGGADFSGLAQVTAQLTAALSSMPDRTIVSVQVDGREIARAAASGASQLGGRLHR